MYGITKEEVAQLRAAQRDQCAICQDPSPQHLDHDHVRGGTRQLLCQRCNQGLGLFRDDPGLLHMAAFYVEHHMQQQAIAVLQAAGAEDPDGQADVSGRR
ncbi:endonuclease domain-containing protein [Blastococcus sp. SYSU DS0669]